MKVELIAEYYDGLIQGVLSDDGHLFYAFCIHADFPDVGQDRAYWVTSIDDEEERQLRACLSRGTKAFDALLRARFLHRDGVVLKGEPASWSGRDLCCGSRGDAHARFLRFPAVDVLAGMSSPHAPPTSTSE